MGFTSEPGRVQQPKVTRHIRLNFKSTIKEGWGYESTVTLDIESEEADGVEPFVREHMQDELKLMNDVARNVAEREIRIRTQRPIDPLGPLPGSMEIQDSDIPEIDLTDYYDPDSFGGGDE